MRKASFLCHTICSPQTLVFCHIVMRAVELETRNSWVAIHTCWLLETGSQILGNLAKDDDLVFDDPPSEQLAI